MIRYPILALIALFALPSGPARAEAGCPAFREASEGLPTKWEWRTHPAVGDVNGDGHPDIAGHPRKGRGPNVWLGDGKGTWTHASQGLAIPGMSCGNGTDFGDLDGDGDLDLVVSDHCHGVFAYLNDGQGVWRMSDSGRITDSQGYEDVEIGDLNGDGHADLVAVGSFNGGITAYVGDGTGHGWREYKEAGLPKKGFGRDVKLADLNGDGRLDIVAAFSADIGSDIPFAERNAIVWMSNGDGRFHRAARGIAADREHRGVAVGDVNGDGIPDLATSEVAYRENHGNLRVYLGDGQGSWKESSEGLPGPEKGLTFAGVALADLDGDGNRDLVALTWLDAAIRVWRGDGQGHWKECSETGLPSGRTEMRSAGVTVADLNGDGKLDIVGGFGRRGTGRLEAWLQK